MTRSRVADMTDEQANHTSVVEFKNGNGEGAVRVTDTATGRTCSETVSRGQSWRCARVRALERLWRGRRVEPVE